MNRRIAHTAANRQLRHEAGNPVYTYDAHGNMTTMPHLTAITWNYADLLRSASNGTFTSRYVYNAGGGRTRKVVVKGNIREERLYLGNYELYRKYVNNTLDTERQTLHIADDQHRFALIDRLTIDNGITLSTPVVSTRYQYDNHLGSASLELDQNAAIISYEEYHPFGTTSYRSGRTETEVALKRYKYVGKERDEETGLYYYGARYYAAWIARFVSVDPLQLKYPHYTPYQYAGNKPVSYIDLDGLEEAKTTEEKKPEENKSEEKKELRVPQNEIWGVGRFGGLNLGIVSERFIESKSGRYTLHGIESGPNKGNWLVREQYGDGLYRNSFIAGPEAFKEVFSEKFEEHGTALDRFSIGILLGADPTASFGENMKSALLKAWSPENIVANLSLGVKAMEKLAEKMAKMAAAQAAKAGTTVLGHYPEYVKLAESIGTRRFQIPTSVWNKMSAAEQWTANTKFLDRMILRGDKIRLATPLNQVKPGSFFQKELNYLFDKGYKVSPDGLWLTK